MAGRALNHSQDLQRWALPSHGLRLDFVDAHCGGELLRLVVAGFPPPPGATMLERQRYAEQHLDHLRRALTHEPRGHAPQYGALLTPPETADSHFGLLFFNSAGFHIMAGHEVIAAATILIETGLAGMNGPETRLKLDTVAGVVRAYARIEDARVTSVFFENVPAVVVASGRSAHDPAGGDCAYDLASAGGLHAFVSAQSLELVCSVEHSAALRQAGIRLHGAIGAHLQVDQPAAEAAVLAGVVFFDQPPLRRGARASADTRQVCVSPDGALSRGPAAGLSGRVALEMARANLELGQPFVVEGLLGTTMVGKAVQETGSGGRCGLVTEIEGRAFITGVHSAFIDADDPFAHGFVAG